ncbi:MAG: hypothetical protein HQL08_06995, partial [Nitrospirae bacterium]|nr:hypothetical protein [Nitrospirota bacterium]
EAQKELIDFSHDTSLWEKIIEERELERERKRRELLRFVEDWLKIYFRGKRIKSVYIFGSLLRHGQFYDFSDVDIAVEGLEDDYFKTILEIEDIVGRDVELVEVEKCRFGEAIKQHGLMVA